MTHRFTVQPWTVSEELISNFKSERRSALTWALESKIASIHFNQQELDDGTHVLSRASYARDFLPEASQSDRELVEKMGSEMEEAMRSVIGKWERDTEGIRRELDKKIPDSPHEIVETLKSMSGTDVGIYFRASVGWQIRQKLAVLGIDPQNCLYVVDRAPVEGWVGPNPHNLAQRRYLNKFISQLREGRDWAEVLDEATPLTSRYHPIRRTMALAYSHVDLKEPLENLIVGQIAPQAFTGSTFEIALDRAYNGKNMAVYAYHAHYFEQVDDKHVAKYPDRMLLRHSEIDNPVWTFKYENLIPELVLAVADIGQINKEIQIVH